MGPLYIKIGQLLSYNYPIFRELYDLQNNCPGLDNKDFLYYQQKYKHLNILPEKIAAGSISVVYPGKHKDKKIAVKIKRPNIEKYIKNNIYYANIVKNILKFMKLFVFFNLNEKIDFIFDIYVKQLDFEQEVQNWKIYTKNNKGILNLKIPFFFQELCNEEIIVMEYLTGNNIVINKIIDKEKKIKIGHCIMGQYISGIMKGFIHGDFHCGNFSYKKDYVIVYDFGIMIQLSKKQINCLMDIINSLFESNIEKTIKIIIDNFIENNNNIQIGSISDLEKQLRNENFDFFTIILKIKNILENRGLRFNNQMIGFEISLLALNNTIQNLNISESGDYLINDLINRFQNEFLEL